MEIKLPHDTAEFGESPNLSFPDTRAPQGLHCKVLKEGTGRVVQSGQEVEVNYYGQIWNGPVFDSSYPRGATVRFPIGIGLVIAGWDKAIVGKTVGSRLLLSIPPHLGYGPAGNPRAGISGEDTLVFVVDIVGTHDR